MAEALMCKLFEWLAIMYSMEVKEKIVNKKFDNIKAIANNSKLTDLFVFWVARGGMLLVLLFAAVTSSMAQLHIQTATKFQNTTSTTITCTFAAASTTGNLIVVHLDWSGQTRFISTVTDNKGNTYTRINGPTNWDGANYRAELWYAYNITGGGVAITVTATLSGAPTIFSQIYISEYSGIITTSNPLDQNSVAIGNTAAVSSGSKTTTMTNELIYGASIGASGALATGAGFTNRSAANGNIIEDKNVTTTGSYNAAFTCAGGNWIAQMATFIATSQPISTGIINGSPFCKGANVSVPYTITGIFIAGNVFTAQLSDASGSFAAPVAIGTLTSTAAGTISGTIPIGTSAGALYRIRVVSSTPARTGTDNGSNLTVNPDNTVTLSSAVGTDAQTKCINTAITNITYTTTGATGANVTGLPAGVTGSWLANVVTISGTPTASGPFTYTVTLTGGCGAITKTGTITVTPDNTVTLSSAVGTDAQTKCINTAITNITYTTTGATGANVTGLPAGVTGIWLANVVTISGTPTASGPFTYTVTLTGGCGAITKTGTITVTALPVATFSYTGTPYCINAANPSPTFSGGGVAGTFSSTAGLVFVSTATGQINLAASTAGTYTVTNTIAASGGCGIVTATSPITIISDLIWTGTVSTDWNVPGNWSCGFIPDLTTFVQIPNVANKPVLSGGTIGAANNIVIDNSSSLTIVGNTIQISGTITNNGTFTSTVGTIEMKGSGAQLIGANVFAGNTIKDLIINNPAGVTLQGPLNITGIVTAQNGNLSSGGNLTLVSTAAQTALIDGSGTGTVTGNVTMQRYLASGFGYKYFSSPFQASTVSEFGDDMNLSASFPTFYGYDESRVSAGWVIYINPAWVLNPMNGYAVNFGSNVAALTPDVTGIVNNGSLSLTLYNNNNTYTKGFNLVGNPYPSPIDWDASPGWTKTNIDNAVYYFKASITDQYGGTYSTYINGVSSDGLATKIIPSMQGFFVHVSDGAWPVTGTLALNNSVRVTDLTHSFIKSAGINSIPLLRLTAGFSDDPASADPMVIYFDEKAQNEFDSRLDALKLMNTDRLVPNLYAVASDGYNLSINALPVTEDSLLVVPLGLKTARDGSITFQIRDTSNLPSGTQIYLYDKETGADQSLNLSGEYNIYLTAGEYNNRFSLRFINGTTDIPENRPDTDLFSIYSSKGNLIADVSLRPGERGTLIINNIPGQIVFRKEIYEGGYHEFNPRLITGIYFVNFITGNARDVKKIFIFNK